MREMRIERLTADEGGRARELFLMMAEVFETECEALGDEYLARLLARGEFWALAATVDGRTVGGLTAHALDFYRALGGEPAAVTIFTFSR